MWYVGLFLVAVAAFAVWFAASLTLLLITPEEDTKRRKTRLTLTIISGVLAGLALLASSIMGEYGMIILGLPIALIGWFVVSLIVLKHTPKEDKRRAGRKASAIISGILAVLTTLIYVSFILLLSLAITNM